MKKFGSQETKKNSIDRTGLFEMKWHWPEQLFETKYPNEDYRTAGILLFLLDGRRLSRFEFKMLEKLRIINMDAI